MSLFTIVYLAEDNGQMTAYGRFDVFGRAVERMRSMERDLDLERDEAGGGVGTLQVVPIRGIKAWEQ